jgi:hypothetical protein
LIPTETQSGWYQKGYVFMMLKRLEASYQYLDLCIDKYPEGPTHQDLALLASKSFARKVVIELENTGWLTDWV